MSQRTKRGLFAFFALSVIAGLCVYAVLVGTGSRKAKAQALPDTGKFRVGSALGEERAGFSGRAKVQVFTSVSSKDWTAVSQCLQSVEVTAQMDFFTGILIEELAEPNVEAVLRERDGLRVVVRGLNGAFLGGLRAGFTCKDFVDLLRSLHANATSAPEKSPIYANLLESPAPIDDLILNGKRADAQRYVGFLQEFEGAQSPAVQNAKARLGL